MSAEEAPSEQPRHTHSLAIAHFRFFCVGVLVASGWTLVGCIASYYLSDLRVFLEEWERYQVFPSLGLAIWLMLLARSDIFPIRMRRAIKDDTPAPPGLKNRILRFALGTLMLVLAASTSIGMGFNASWPLILFFWATAVFAGVLAGIVMVHTIEVIVSIHQLQRAALKTFHYAPARTPELKDIVAYFATFALILSVAYFFAFVGTVRGRWLGSPLFIQAVQLFWPMIYVPVCSATLLYPHFVMHSLIQQEKERTIVPYQKEIDNLLVGYQSLDNEAIQRVNSLTQLVDRVIGTPDYVLDFGISIKTLAPLALNLVMLLAKPVLAQVSI